MLDLRRDGQENSSATHQLFPAALRQVAHICTGRLINATQTLGYQGCGLSFTVTTFSGLIFEKVRHRHSASHKQWLVVAATPSHKLFEGSLCLRSDNSLC